MGKRLMDNYTAEQRKIGTQHSPPTSAQTARRVEFVAPTPKQRAILEYYALGFNPIPVDPESKVAPYWKQLQTTRLYHDLNDIFNHRGMLAAFQDNANVAVMMGRTSGNLFVIDCETEAAYNFVLTELEERAIPLWVSRTPSGGAHFYFRAKREVSNVPLGKLSNVIEIRGHGGYCLTAPSIVRGSDKINRRYIWERKEGDQPHLIDLTRIDFLHDKSGERVRLKFRKNTNRSALKDNETGLYLLTLDYISNGHKLKGTKTRNIRLYKASSDLYRHGNNHADIEAKLLPIALDAGTPVAEAKRTIASACNPKHDTDRRTDQPAKTPSHILARQWLDANPLTGRTAAVDDEVMRAFISIAARTPHDDIIRASSRELADLARVTRKTAQAAMKRIIDGYGLLKVMDFRDKVSDAKCYKFTPVCLYPTYSVAINTVSSSGVKTHTPDAAERYALGKTGLRVYRAMCRIGAPMVAQAIAKASGLGIAAVRNALRTTKPLRTSGLVTLTNEGFIARDVDDDELNVVTGAPIGKGEQRIKQHATERAQRATQFLIEKLEKRYARTPKGKVNVPASDLLKCPNCGQLIAADFGAPDMCDYCKDFTTWQQMAQPVSASRKDH